MSFCLIAAAKTTAQIPDYQFQLSSPTPTNNKFSWTHSGQVIEGFNHYNFYCPENKRRIGFYFHNANTELSTTRQSSSGQAPSQINNRTRPVLYILGPGTQGSEASGLALAQKFLEQIKHYKLPAMHIVSVNGGPSNFYTKDIGSGEKGLLSLVQHIDSQFKTIRQRSGRSLIGLNEGGQAASRLLFTHPELFARAISANASFAQEHQHSKLPVTNPLNKNNSWQLAFLYAKQQSPLRVELLQIGHPQHSTWPANEAYSSFLEQLGIQHRLAPLKLEAEPQNLEDISILSLEWLLQEKP
ncbi:hypothetical protein [Agaribacterium sp. ZY112]|uniref:hypothetical protein n=1 Tax=Agaribacterium sp. ZY112 TaxID=3233574 RepID=UPI003526A20D